MIERILIGADGSDSGEQALHYGLAAARQLNASADVMHVVQPPPGFARGAGAVLVEQHLMRDGQAVLEAAERRASEHGLALRGQLVFGTPATALLSAATHHDLLVVGTQGRRGLERALLGSVAEQLVRESATPVLTVHREAPQASRTWTDWAVRRALVLTDFSPAATRALSLVRQNSPWADLTLLHVFEPGSLAPPSPAALMPPEAGHPPRRVEVAAAQRLLDALGGGEVVPGDPAEVALERALDGQFDLIVMGSSGRSAMSSWVFGSVAQRVVREAPVPVLTVRAPTVQGQA